MQLVVLDRIDPARNMARYYVLSIEPTLFDDSSLVREWGGLDGVAGGGSSFTETTATPA